MFPDLPTLAHVLTLSGIIDTQLRWELLLLPLALADSAGWS